MRDVLLCARHDSGLRGGIMIGGALLCHSLCVCAVDVDSDRFVAWRIQCRTGRSVAVSRSIEIIPLIPDHPVVSYSPNSNLGN